MRNKSRGTELNIEFYIQVPFQGKVYRYFVAHVSRTLAYDYYHVITRSSTLVLRNNQPLLVKHQLKDRPTWSIEEGSISNQEFKDALIEQVNLVAMEALKRKGYG
jgi:hypothetical protein